MLLLTNPTADDYAEHAGRQLVTVLSAELCRSEAVPMLLRLWIRDCPDMVASQQQNLADVAARFTTRLNLGVASIYITQLGGQELAPGLRLPRVKAMTLAVAGRFVMLRTERDNGSLE